MTKTTPAPLTKGCPHCQHTVVQAVSAQGERLELDTTAAPTWVLTGKTLQGIPLAVQSRGYCEHGKVCVGDQHE